MPYFVSLFLLETNKSAGDAGPESFVQDSFQGNESRVPNTNRVRHKLCELFAIFPTFQIAPRKCNVMRRVSRVISHWYHRVDHLLYPHQ